MVSHASAAASARDIVRPCTRWCLAWLTLVALGGCTALPSGMTERETADAIAAAGGLQPEAVSAGGFRLLSYRRGLDRTAASDPRPVHVYLEGDGRSWRRRRPPPDPTPSDPLGLRLAAQDPAPAVLWLGRPCTYLPREARASCDRRWWTSHRYAATVVEAMNELISRAVRGREVVLVGHSGGGALAALLAARRQDVMLLITVASPLDLRFWATTGGMTPLVGSLDPADAAPRLARLPQRHLCGGRDRVVSTEVVRRFVQAIPTPNLARLEIYPEYSHTCCWERSWRDLLARRVTHADPMFPDKQFSFVKRHP